MYFYTAPEVAKILRVKKSYVYFSFSLWRMGGDYK